MSAPLLRVETAVRRFAGLVAVDHVSLSVDAGEAVGIVGPNGAGKTTLFNLISGQLPLSSGRIAFKGEAIDGLKPNERARRGIGRTFQVTKPMVGMTTLENVMVGAFLRHDRHDAAFEAAYDVLEEVGLADRAGRPINELTLSERRRLEVARALATEPVLILLDEVMAGLNATEIDAQISLMRRLAQRGIAFVLIEHNLNAVRSFCERVAVLDRGAKIAEGTADDVLSDPRVVEAYIGRART